MIVEKVKDALRYKKYRENLEKNLKVLSTKEFIDDPFEKEMFFVKQNFTDLLKDLWSYLKKLYSLS